MNPDPSPEPPTEILGRVFAQRLALGLLAVFVLVVVCAFFDRTHRPQLESARPQASAARMR